MIVYHFTLSISTPKYIFEPITQNICEVYMTKRSHALIIVYIVSLILTSFFVLKTEKQVCDAKSIYSMLTPKVVEFYEKEIAGEAVLSNKTDAGLRRTAKALSIDVEKTRAIILLQDFASRTGDSVNLSTLAKMSELKLLSFAKERADIYLKDLPPERVQYLKSTLKSLISHR